MRKLLFISYGLTLSGFGNPSYNECGRGILQFIEGAPPTSGYLKGY